MEDYNLVDRGPSAYNLRNRERFIDADPKSSLKQQSEISQLMSKSELARAKIDAIDEHIKSETDAILIYEQEAALQEMNALVESLDSNFGCRLNSYDRNASSFVDKGLDFSQLRMLADVFRFAQQAVVAILLNNEFGSIEPTLIRPDVSHRDQVEFVDVFEEVQFMQH